MSCKTITVFSNKGGVGKTFVAVNLATVLAQAGNKVLLIDASFNGKEITIAFACGGPVKTCCFIIDGLHPERLQFYGQYYIGAVSQYACPQVVVCRATTYTVCKAYREGSSKIGYQCTHFT